ncbi:MAG: sensor histidine kinase [Melioribacteraceae bacterium]
MRLIKEKTTEYESFHKSLQYFTKQSAARGDLKLISFENHRVNSNLLEKYSFFVQNVSSFQKRIQNIESVIELNSIFQEFVKKIIFSKEVEIFLFNDSRRNLIPLNSAATQTHIAAVNKAYKDGILDWIYETKKATIIPDLNLLTANGSKLNQIIFPIFDRKVNYGLLSILTPITKVQDDSLENQSVQILLSMIIPMIINLRQKQSINKLYQELQVYQSKMKNDFDTYAIGELAQGILEEIGEPLQVILSYTNDIENEQTVESEVTDKIKQQVKKISDLAERLVKFSGLNKPQPQKSQPCEINKVLREFIGVIKTTLDNLGLECELDLEENMPPVLSDPKDIKQMLTSIFSIIKSNSKKGGAIVIQTKYIKEKIVLSVFTTEQLVGLSNPEEYNSNITVKLINELMKKNEGVVEFNSLPLKGTIIHLIFPMKRKLNL